MWSKMKPSLISLLLLLAGLSFSDTHTLPKLQDIPDAPALPRLNLDILPNYIKALLFNESDENKHNAKNTVWDDQIEYQVKNLQDSVNHEEIDDGHDHSAGGERRAKTYGMRITGDRGTVWNDLTQVLHHVGKLDNVTSVGKPEENHETSTSDTAYNISIGEDRIDDDFHKNPQEEKVEDDSVGEKEDLGENIFDVPTDYLEEEIEAEVKNLLRLNNHPPTNGNDKKKEAKTYGMSLSGESGTVWNELNSAHVSYHVGEPHTVTNAPKLEYITKTPTLSNEKIESSIEEEKVDNNLSESKDKVVDEISDNNKNPEEVDLVSKEIKESFDEIKRVLEELIKNKPENPGDRDINKVSEEDKKKSDKKTQSPNENKNTSEINTHKPNINKKEPTASEIIRPDGGNHDNKDLNKDKDKGTETIQDNNMESNIKEMVKNLMNEIRSMIKKEVETQIKQYFNDHEDNISKENDIDKAKNYSTIDKPTKTSNGSNADTESLILDGKKVNDTGSNDTIADQITSKSNATENDKAENKLKSKKTQNKDDTHTPVKIESQNVYGSSLGNGKVTNIFIFNISNSSDLQHIKPISNGSDGVFKFGVDKKPDQEKNIDKLSVEHKEETKPDENTPNGNNNEIHSDSENNKPEFINNKPEDPEKENNKSNENKNYTNSNKKQTKPSDDRNNGTSEKPSDEKGEAITDEIKGDSSSETAKIESLEETVSTTTENKAASPINDKTEDEKANTHPVSNENEESKVDIDKRSNMNDKSTEDTNKDAEDITVVGTDKTKK